MVSKSISEIKKTLVIQGINYTRKELIGYYIGDHERPMRRRLHYYIKENGKIRIKKRSTVNRQVYEKLLNQYGIGKSRTFTEIEENLTT